MTSGAVISQPNVVVLLALFSSDSRTSTEMDQLLREHILGLGKLGNRPGVPQIRCLYRRFAEPNVAWSHWKNKDAYQFDLTRSMKLPLGEEQTKLPAKGTSAAEQLSDFFASAAELVKDAQKVVFVLGGHGQGAIGLSLIQKILFNLFGIDPYATQEKSLDKIRRQSVVKRMLLGWLQKILVRWAPKSALWHPNSVFVSPNRTDAKVDMTIAELKSCMSGLNRNCDAAVFHICFLGSLEVFHELRLASSHFIACASRLYPTMHVSDWLPSICDPTKSAVQIGQDWATAETRGYARNQKPEGLFGSYVATSTTEFVKKLELLAIELLKVTTDPETTGVRLAQGNSLVESNQPIVDLYAFCDQLQANKNLPLPLQNAARSLKNEIQDKHCGTFQSNNSYLSSIAKKGISVHVPFRKSLTANGPLQVISFIDSLPDQFANDAPQWIAFLQYWAPQSYELK